MECFTAFAPFCDSYNVSVWMVVNNVKKFVYVLMHLQAFCDSYGTKYVSYDVPLAMKTVFILALFGDEFTSPYITVN